MRRSDQRRDAVFALYQREVTGRPLDELLAEREAVHPRAGRGRRRRTATSSTRRSPATRKGWALERIAPLERNIMRVALYEIAAPRRRPGRGRDRRGGRARQGVLRRRRARVRQRGARRGRRAEAATGERGVSVSRLSEHHRAPARDRRRASRGRASDEERAAELAREAAELVGRGGRRRSTARCARRGARRRA